MEFLSMSWKVLELDIGKCMYGTDLPTVVVCRSNQLVPLPLNAASVAAPILKL